MAPTWKDLHLPVPPPGPPLKQFNAGKNAIGSNTPGAASSAAADFWRGFWDVFLTPSFCSLFLMHFDVFFKAQLLENSDFT